MSDPENQIVVNAEVPICHQVGDKEQLLTENRFSHHDGGLILPQVGAKLGSVIYPQVGGELYSPVFHVSWGHHKYEPTIGLLVCKTKDNTMVKWALESSQQHIGASEYRISEILPQEVASDLPSISDIEFAVSER